MVKPQGGDSLCGFYFIKNKAISLSPIGALLILGAVGALVGKLRAVAAALGFYAGAAINEIPAAGGAGRGHSGVPAGGCKAAMRAWSA